MLKGEQINYSYDQHTKVLENINFEIAQGEMLGIIGPNGGGKSTLLKLIVGLLELKQGKLIFADHSLPQPEIIAYVPQVQELNNALPMRVSDFLRLLPRKPTRSIEECLKRVGLSEKRDALMRELSGGQRQRALLARALRLAPKLLVLDEPTAGLDSQGQDQLMLLLKSLQKDDHTTLVIVDHNITQVLKHADKILCLNRHHHWHERKELLTKNIIEDIYHCEFEHLRLHEAGSQFDDDHHACPHEHHHEEQK